MGELRYGKALVLFIFNANPKQSDLVLTRITIRNELIVSNVGQLSV